MDFTDTMQGGKVQLSPDNTMVAGFDGCNIVVRDVDSLEVLSVFSCSDVITNLLWSPDSGFLAAIQSKRAEQQLFSIHDTAWRGDIQCGIQGLVDACWTPDSRHLVTFTECNLRMYVWSLQRNTVASVPFPKYMDSRSIAFSADGQYMSVLTRSQGVDSLFHFCLQSWSVQTSTALPTTDVASMKIVSNKYIVQIDSVIDYNVYIYDYSCSLVRHISPYIGKLGVSTSCVSNTECFVCLGSYDNTLRQLNTETWEITCALAFPALVSKMNKAVLYKEDILDGSTTAFKVIKAPMTQPTVVMDSNKFGPRTGIKFIQCSVQDKFIGVVSEHTPSTVFIVDVATAAINSIVTVMHAEGTGISSIAWDPIRLRLAVAAGHDRIYVWSNEGCSVVSVPQPGFKVQAQSWTATGDCILVNNDVSFCLCYVK